MPKPYQPTPREIESLLKRATSHPLGTGFLVEGSLDAVAATFGVHAFVVEEARRRVSADAPRTAASTR
jgi:hypothetical protein